MSQKEQKNSNEFIDFGEIFLYYLKYWKWFILSFIICIGFSYYYLKSTPKIFQTNSNILIKTDDSKSPMGSSSILKSFGMGGLSSSQNIDDEIEVLSSHSLTRKMVQKLGLNNIYTLKKFPFDNSFYNNSPIEVSYPIIFADTLSDNVIFDIQAKNGQYDILAKLGKTEIGNFSIHSFPTTINTEIGDFTFKLIPENQKKDKYNLEIVILGLDYAAEVYMRKVSVAAASRRANIINLIVNESDKQRGKDILNEIVDLYNIDGLDDKNIAAKNTVEFISIRIDSLAKELLVIETGIENYKKDNNIIDLQAEGEYILSLVGDIKEKSLEYQIQLRLMNEIENYLSDPQQKFTLIPLASGLPESVSKSIQEYNEIILERTHLLRNANENNPTVVSLDEKISYLKKNVDLSIRNIKSEFEIALQEHNQMNNQIQNRINQLPRQEREFIEISREQKIKSEIYLFLLEKLQEAELTLASNTPKAKIVDAAYTLSKPIAPKPFVILIIGLITGFLLPIICLWIKDAFKIKLSTKEELEKKTFIPVLGEVCKDRSGENVVVSETSTSATTELFRLIRTNLQFVLTKKEEKVILVTSSISGEGKSFFTVNLARSLSLIKDKKVILVGLDIRAPKLAEYLSVNSKAGITTYLSSDEYTPEDVIVKLSNFGNNLSLIPSGPIPPNPSELLLSDRLDILFEYLRAHYDYIIVDAAPVGMVSDTFSLARISDATIYLYRANYTNKSHLKFAETVVKENKLKKVSLVINGTTSKSGYGYGYGEKK